MPDILDRNSYRGEKLEYWGRWQGMQVGVILRKPEHLPEGMFVLSIVSPLFNVNREICSNEVLREMDKIYEFLNHKPAGVSA